MWQLLKENTAAYKGSPPCSQSQLIPSLAIIITTIITIISPPPTSSSSLSSSASLSLHHFNPFLPPLLTTRRLIHFFTALSANPFKSVRFSFSLSHYLGQAQGRQYYDNILYGLFAAAGRGQILCMLWVLTTKRGVPWGGGGVPPLVCNSLFAKKNLQIMPHKKQNLDFSTN